MYALQNVFYIYQSKAPLPQLRERVRCAVFKQDPPLAPSIQASYSQSMVVTRSLLLSHSVRPIFWVPSVLRSNRIVKPTTTSTEPRRARAKSSFYEDFKTHLTDESRRSPRKRQHWIYASTKSSTGNGRIVEESDESQEDDADLKASIAAPP